MNGANRVTIAESHLSGQAPIAVYVHIPFCPSKCHYCDFNSYALGGKLSEADVPRTVAAIEADILRSPLKGRPAKTIFFGGGTPTYLDGESLNRLLAAVAEVHPFAGNVEITSEANPGLADAAKFATMVEGGFNRLSIGVQSFDDADLIRLGRVHRVSETHRAIQLAKEAGFTNINLDLMYALPHHTLSKWQESLAEALNYRPNHLSLYHLAIEPGTNFAKRFREGTLPLPDEEVQASLFETTLTTLQGAGYEPYEISNFALPGFECAHNLAYWRGEEYAGYGPGAVGTASTPEGQRRRATKTRHPRTYCEQIEAGGEAVEHEEIVPDDVHVKEQIMLGLRLREGVSLALLPEAGVTEIIGRGWGEILFSGSERAALRLTDAGRIFCSEATILLF